MLLLSADERVGEDLVVPPEAVEDARLLRRNVLVVVLGRRKAIRIHEEIAINGHRILVHDPNQTLDEAKEDHLPVAYIERRRVEPATDLSEGCAMSHRGKHAKDVSDVALSLLLKGALGDAPGLDLWTLGQQTELGRGPVHVVVLEHGHKETDVQEDQVFDALLDEIEGDLCQLTDALDVVEAVDKGQDAGGR